MSGIVAQNTLDNTGLIKSPSGGGGAWNFISKQTASADSTISFTSGIDSTYKEYIFYFVNIHPEDYARFQFNLSTDGGSSYNVTKTSTHFEAHNPEGGVAAPNLLYVAALDLAEGTGVQALSETVGNDETEDCLSGHLRLFQPSSTTFVKPFMSLVNHESAETTWGAYVAGYGNTTSAIDAIQFSMCSGNIDSGDIFLHGLTT